MSEIQTNEVLENEIEVRNAFEVTDEVQEESVAETSDSTMTKGLRKLNPKYKTKAERQAEREALSELEAEDYVPEEHEPKYDVHVDKSVYRGNYALSAVLITLGIVMLPYTKVGTALLWFYGCGTAWMVYSAMRLTIHVDGNNFTLEGAGGKKDGTYHFDDIEKIIYTYNKKSQRRYKVYKDGHKLFEIAPGSIHGRWLYDDMMAYGVPGGWYNRL